MTCEQCKFFCYWKQDASGSANCLKPIHRDQLPIKTHRDDWCSSFQQRPWECESKAA